MARDYWIENRFSCRFEGEELRGRRGSWLGNLVAFNVDRLRANLTVRFEGSHLECELIVDAAYQDFTEWSFCDLTLECLLFRGRLLGRSHPDFLEDYERSRRSSAWRWITSMGMHGRELPKDLGAKVRALGDGLTMPAIARLQGSNR